jgi:hypothetical protein
MMGAEPPTRAMGLVAARSCASRHCSHGRCAGRGRYGGWSRSRPSQWCSIGRAASVSSLLDREAEVARLVPHHDIPFFVAVEGFARVLALVVVAHHRAASRSARWHRLLRRLLLVAREPPAWASDQPIQLRFRCQSGVPGAVVTSVLDVVDRSWTAGARPRRSRTSPSDSASTSCPRPLPDPVARRQPPETLAY